jgi:hypothetical protein
MSKQNFRQCQSWLSAMLVAVMLLGMFPYTGQIAAAAVGTSYYVDSAAGADSNAGTSESAPWKTLDKVNETVFQPGDRILLKAGEVWNDQTLAPQGSGEAGAPIVVDRYGDGPKPQIRANGKYNDAVKLNNQQYWEINRLDVSNTAPVTTTVAASLGDYRGIHVTGADAGKLQYFRINEVDVHDVSGEIAWISGTVPTTPEPGIRFKTGWDGSKKTGGIVFDTTVNDPANPVRATVFDDVVIENSTVKNTSFAGITFKQYAGNTGSDDPSGIVPVGWGARESASDSKFTPHTNITIRNNYITQRDTAFGCNGMYLTGIKGAIVEHNVVEAAGTSGIEAYYADDITIQYNEVFDTMKKAGGADSNGIDPDKGTTNILIQYNYVHDNGDGILICQFVFGTTTVRYNVLESNSRYPIYLHSDRNAVADVYNNTIYNDKSNYMIYGYGTSLNGTYNIYNNIMYTTRSVQDLTVSPTITYDYNSYYATSGTFSAPAGDVHALTGNPGLVNPGSGVSGSEANGPNLAELTGYQLKSTSHLVNRGLAMVDVSKEQVRDLAGRMLYNGAPDLGAFEYYNDSAATTTLAGRITNVAGKGMSGVVITDKAGSAITATTDAAGYYAIENVPVNSTVNLQAGKIGYNESESGSIAVTAGNVITTDMVLSSSSSTGQLAGTVLDESLQPAAGAAISLSLDGQEVLATVTGDNGEYSFPSVTIGDDYQITVAKEGYRSATVRAISIQPALLTTAPVLYAVSKQPEELHSSDFNQLAVGAQPGSPWVVTTAGGSIGAADLPSAEDRSIKLTRTTNSGSTSMSQSFAPGVLKGIVTIEADVMKQDHAGTTNWISLPYVYSSAGTASANVGVSVAFSKGQIVAYKGGTSTNLMAYEENKWYKLKLVMNTGSSRFDLYVNDVLVVDQAAFRNAIPDIGRIEYYANSSNYGTAYVDNIKIYKGIPQDRSDARLESLTDAGGLLQRQSDGSYMMEVPYFVDSVTLTATASSPDYQSLKVNGQDAVSGQQAPAVSLAEGLNDIPVVIVAENGTTTNTVNVAVNRTPAAADSTLKSLAIAGNTGAAVAFTPEFAYNKENYTIQVGADVTGLTVTPAAGAPQTEIRVNGKVANSGQAAAIIPLLTSESEITVTTASQDGTDYRTYNVVVTWEGTVEPEVPEVRHSTVTPATATFDKNQSARADLEFDVQLNGNTLTEIRLGDTLLAESGYTVTGSAYKLSAAYLTGLSVGDYSLTFKFSDGDDAVVALKIVDTTPPASGGEDGGNDGGNNGNEGNTGGGNGGSTPSTGQTAGQFTLSDGLLTSTPQLATGSTAAKAEISQDVWVKALEDAKADQAGQKIIKLAVNPVQDAAAYEVVMPIEALSGDLNDWLIEVQTPFAKLLFAGNMLAELQAGSGKKAAIAIVQSDGLAGKEGASTAAEASGGRPVIELSVSVDGKAIEWANDSSPVTVEIPYTLSEAERSNPEQLTVWYVNEAGQTFPVVSGRYAANTKTVTFTVKHFSTYAIVSNPKSFADIVTAEWARKAVESLAAKGILNGVTAQSFVPGAQVSRADFAVMLVKTFGLETNAAVSPFDDVRQESYYAKAVYTAKALGIVSGVDSRSFNPDGNITRQEMFVMIDRALRLAGAKLAATEQSPSAVELTDLDAVAVYALSATERLANAGLIKGYNGQIRPTALASRAEAAVLLYGIYNELYQ